MKVIAFILVIVFTINYSIASSSYRDERFVNTLEIEMLLDGIRKVESQDGKYLNGKNGELGPYQIKRITIDDVNRILGVKKYKYEDALDEEKSREICRIYIEYWSKKRNCYGNLEMMARIWNGGPNGHKKESTLIYWEKVKEEINVNN